MEGNLLYRLGMPLGLIEASIEITLLCEIISCIRIINWFLLGILSSY